MLIWLVCFAPKLTPNRGNGFFGMRSTSNLINQQLLLLLLGIARELVRLLVLLWWREQILDCAGVFLIIGIKKGNDEDHPFRGIKVIKYFVLNREKFNFCKIFYFSNQRFWFPICICALPAAAPSESYIGLPNSLKWDCFPFEATGTNHKIFMTVPRCKFYFASKWEWDSDRRGNTQQGLGRYKQILNRGGQQVRKGQSVRCDKG